MQVERLETGREFPFEGCMGDLQGVNGMDWSGLVRSDPWPRCSRTPASTTKGGFLKLRRQRVVIIVPQCVVSLGGSLWAPADPGPRWPAQRHLLQADHERTGIASGYRIAINAVVREISWWLASGNCARPDKLQAAPTRSRTDLAGHWWGDQASRPGSLQRFGLHLGWGTLLLGAVLGAWVQQLVAILGATRWGRCDERPPGQ